MNCHAEPGDTPGFPCQGAQSEARAPTKEERQLFAISSYTRRQLTRQSDILRAISDLAHGIHALSAHRYVAGLWESRLLRSLIRGSAWNGEKGLESHARPAEYCALGWSWVSVCGHVAYGVIAEYIIYHKADPELLPAILEIKAVPARAG
jgi:hypothetical protein